MADSFLQYGSYDHLPASCQFTINKAAVFGQTGEVEFYRHIWDIRGFVQGANESAITAAIDAIEAAYETHGVDLKFMLASGSPSSHVLTSSECLDGTQVKRFAWLGNTVRGSGVEYVLKRSFAAQVMGDVDPGYHSTDYVFWTETVQRIGDGTANHTWIESLAGAPQAQQTNAYTRCVTIQTGYCIGRTGYPDVAGDAPPIWGAPYYRARESAIGYTTPKQLGVNANRNYGANWRYVFHSATPLVGSPTELP